MFIFEMNFYLFSYFGNKSQAIWFRTLNIENNLSWLSWIKLAKPVALLIFQQDFKIGENKSDLRYKCGNVILLNGSRFNEVHSKTKIVFMLCHRFEFRFDTILILSTSSLLCTFTDWVGLKTILFSVL